MPIIGTPLNAVEWILMIAYPNIEPNMFALNVKPVFKPAVK